MGTSTTSSVVESDIDTFSREFFDDPWPHLAALRAAAPAVKLTKYGIWAIAGHADVTTALRDYDTFCSGAGVGMSNFHKETPWRPPSVILEADPPDHTRARKVLADVLSPVNVKSMREMFDRVANEMVDALHDGEVFDGVKDLAEAYPLKVFPDAVGVTPTGREHLLAYGNMVFNSFGPRNEFFEQGMQGAAQTREWIGAQCARSALKPDGLGAEIYSAADRGEITEEDAGLLLRSFLSAGVDTTVSALTSSLWCLATNPSQWDALKADPTHGRPRRLRLRHPRVRRPGRCTDGGRGRARRVGPSRRVALAGWRHGAPVQQYPTNLCALTTDPAGLRVGLAEFRPTSDRTAPHCPHSATLCRQRGAVAALVRHDDPSRARHDRLARFHCAICCAGRTSRPVISLISRRNND